MKQRHPGLMFKGVPFIFTTNKLPAVMKEPIKKPNEDEWEYKDRYNNYMAFMTRCRIHRIDQSHRNTERFPYTTEELAIYMDHICNIMKPVTEDDEVKDQSPELDSIDEMR